MKFTYYPEQIVEALAHVAKETNEDILGGAEAAVSELKGICENPYNRESFRDLYKLLMKVTDRINQNLVREQKGDKRNERA